MLKKHDGLRPEAKPLETKFKDEPIYERSMITKLHSKARWKR
jgi:Rad4 beta-hairpin domain 1.